MYRRSTRSQGSVGTSQTKLSCSIELQNPDSIVVLFWLDNDCVGRGHLRPDAYQQLAEALDSKDEPLSPELEGLVAPRKRYAIYDVDNESLLPTVYDSYKEAAEDAADLTDSGSVVQIIEIEV